MTELAWFVNAHMIPAAFSLLPGQMNSTEARAQLLAIGFQESGFIARQQGGTKKTPGHGPAKSLWQLELNGGVRELLDHKPSASILLPICDLLGYPDWSPAALHEAIEHNCVLALVMARLLLYKDPRTMPTRGQHAKGWQIYLARWRPGDPHPAAWPGNFDMAWEMLVS